MKSKRTQIELVKAKLLKKNKVSRNWCLANYISRLSSIIFILRNEGMEINGSFVKTGQGKDYVYTLAK